MALMLRCLIDHAGEFSQIGVTVLKRLSRSRIDKKAVVESDQRNTSDLLIR